MSSRRTGPNYCHVVFYTNHLPRRMGIDIMSVSSHKFHGPKGVGARYIRDRVKVKPVIDGGGQHIGMISGTENVPVIAGIALSAEMT